MTVFRESSGCGEESSSDAKRKTVKFSSFMNFLAPD